MNRLRNFLRLRKQHDSMKIALILFLCAAYFFVSGVMQIVNYFGYVRNPAEYILNAVSASAALDSAPLRIRETGGVLGASFQREYMIALGENAVLVIELSPEYLLDCYGIRNTGGGGKIWLNAPAFDALFGEAEESSIHRTYFVNEEVKSAEFIKCDRLGADEPLAVTSGTSSSLADSIFVRVMFAETDISGNAQAQLERLGYSIINKEDILMESHKRELAFLHVQYSIIIALLSSAGGYACVQICRYKSSIKQSERNAK